ncbi:uncharacterized protein B0I36DRAFT_351538 [Microdochium trichocladiopsis]|uniref:Uncharacterized protein n=1 Tax=Microdochium trichocladiopsis TaxID=1682393 RepID=A0A9P9BNV3_9PEZI|nr:uncharacterized protein B0I36DRAFT_351538 [Microdochium trichocladiopsis]KAH7028118.1 hypothetical protein B0I36DRAFT_351538 [Microdochium trichocladiopsis]
MSQNIPIDRLGFYRQIIPTDPAALRFDYAQTEECENTKAESNMSSQPENKSMHRVFLPGAFSSVQVKDPAEGVKVTKGVEFRFRFDHVVRQTKREDYTVTGKLELIEPLPDNERERKEIQKGLADTFKRLPEQWGTGPLHGLRAEKDFYGWPCTLDRLGKYRFSVTAELKGVVEREAKQEAAARGDHDARISAVAMYSFHEHEFYVVEPQS